MLTPMPSQYFEDVVEASGLASIIATAAVSRACTRAGVDPNRLDASGLVRALPHLEATLRLYLRDEAEARIRMLKRLASP
jgi:hypothetical protein